MATPGLSDPLAVRDIQINDSSRFNSRGTVDTWRTVTYYLGAHGPFVISDLKATLTGAEIQNRIAAEKADIATIDGVS
jgi:hypothetical protein